MTPADYADKLIMSELSHDYVTPARRERIERHFAEAMEAARAEALREKEE